MPESSESAQGSSSSMMPPPPPVPPSEEQQQQAETNGSSSSKEVPSWARPPPPGAAPHKLETYRDGALIQIISLSKESLVFGRDEKLAEPDGLAIAHDTCSRRHAAVFHDEHNALHIVDFGSSHGTFVDGMKLVPGKAAALAQGASVRFAMSRRTYVVKLAEDFSAEDGTCDMRLGNLPTSFGVDVRKNNRERMKFAGGTVHDTVHDSTKKVDATEKRKREDGDEARAKLAERRRNRAAVDAFAKEMVEAAPSYTKWQPDEKEQGMEVEEDDDGPRGGGEVALKPAEDAGRKEEEEEEEEEEEDQGVVAAKLAKRWEVPISHEITLGGHSKTVSCVAVDPSGTRVITGSLDYKVRLYDFGGMDKHHNSFREIEPDEGHPICSLSYAPGGGDRFLVCTGSAQPQIFTREGAPLLKFNRGDPYVTDMARTTGHVTMVTGGEWHPHEKMQCLTSSRDGSLRLWDLCGKTGLRDFLLCDQTIRVRDKGAKKISATCCAYSPDGRSVVCGSADGAIQMWQIKGRSHNYLRPDACVRGAHEIGTDASGAIISCVKYSPDGHTIASRADDGFVKLWDARKLKGPLAAFGGVSAHHHNANLAWRPDGAVVCAGTAAVGDETGALRFFSAAGAAHELHAEAGGYKPLLSLGIAKKTAVVAVLWHPRIRHIFCGTSAGVTRVMYDPELSNKGALLTVRRNHAKRIIGQDEYHVDPSKIIYPNALPMFRDDSAFKKKGQYSKMRNDPIKSKKPAPPMESGQQGRNTGGKSTFSSFFIENNLAPSIRNDDPREEILKYSEHTPIFRTEATFYKDGEGKRLMDTETLEAAQTAFIDKQKKLLDKTRNTN